MTLEPLQRFDPISLSEMNEVQLMKRMDTKFIIHQSNLKGILNEIMMDYQVLEIDGNRLMTYVSQYYDTPSSWFFHMHHNGIAKRIKIRIRNYVESKISFLEVKQKDYKGSTIKNRIPVDGIDPTLHQDWREFIQSTTGQEFDLIPSIQNSFNRFTLVNSAMKERVTFDLALAFDEEIFDQNLVIIELKQEKLNRTSPVFKVLKKLRIHPYSISKYCMGMAKHHPEIKQNLFKRKFLKINTLNAS